MNKNYGNDKTKMKFLLIFPDYLFEFIEILTKLYYISKINNQINEFLIKSINELNFQFFIYNSE